MEVIIILSKIKQHPLVLGTILLTSAGIISRILGFFYRIFLSHTIGANGLGLYQLIFPIFALCLAISASGIQTAISRFVASAKHPKCYLFWGLLLSTSISVAFSFIIYYSAPWVATNVLKETRTTELLQVLSYAFVPASIHACFNGYYFGKKKSVVPSICQIVEQLARVFGTLLIYQILLGQNLDLQPIHAVWGIVISEFAGLLVSLTAFWGKEVETPFSHNLSNGKKGYLKSITYMAIPLTLNHLFITLSHSVENLLIPQKLVAFGYSTDEALGHFGILTGMALSVIFFPAVITNSLSVLLLPRISEAHAKKDHRLVLTTIKEALCCGLALGSLCTFIFLLSSRWIGDYIFDDPLAGYYIQALSILCPFLYTSGLLNSIVNGLGHAGLTLACNLSGCAVRILAICFLVPIYGMYAYIFSMIGASILTMAELLIVLRRVS